MKITLELLKQLRATPEELKFFERGKLEGLDSDTLNTIDGDYYGFIEWLERFSFNDFEFNDNGQLVKVVYKTGAVAELQYNNGVLDIERVVNGSDTWIYKYNTTGKIIKETSIKGDGSTVIQRFGYNCKGDMVWQRSPIEVKLWVYAYDTAGNPVEVKLYVYNSTGFPVEVKSESYWYKKEYDTNGNCISFQDSEGACWRQVWDSNGILIAFGENEHEVEYWENGQLRQLGSLEIPLIV